MRSDALEQTHTAYDQHSVPEYIILLADEATDLRFWAAYCLGQTWKEDTSPALDALDQTVAFDHTVPTCWGWHVDREALLPFERIHFHQLNPSVGAGTSGPGVWLISPTAEYDTFVHQNRHWTEGRVYATDAVPPITLSIDPNWLGDQLQQHWSDVRLNVRQPRPQAYRLDFQLKLDGQLLIGGLHRDSYALVLTSMSADTVHAFTVWYRSLFPEKQMLYLYEWADIGVSLPFGISMTALDKAVQKKYRGRT